MCQCQAKQYCLPGKDCGVAFDSVWIHTLHILLHIVKKKFYGGYYFKFRYLHFLITNLFSSNTGLGSNLFSEAACLNIFSLRTIKIDLSYLFSIKYHERYKMLQVHTRSFK